MLRIRLTISLLLVCLGQSLWAGSKVLAAAEPAHEQEAPQPPKPVIQLSVPEKKWLGEELYTSEPGNYSVMIWGHAETARAMPEKFDVEEEVCELARHHVDWYDGATPAAKGFEKLQKRFETWGMKSALGFPRWDTVEQALTNGASPSNPTEVKDGKKVKVAPIDPQYVAASLRVIEEQYGEKVNLDWVRAIHFQDEPSGEIPSYDLAPKANMALAKDWDKKVRESFGAGKWGLPLTNWDKTVPQTRLAYQKFWAREFNNYQRTMAQALRARHPKLTIWSANFWFNIGADLLFDYGEMGEFLDAIVADSYATQQEKSAPGRGRWNAGFTTKMVGDLSHQPVYNHIQVIEYHGATPTPEDIREYASQTLRAGGQGLIYYAVDMPQYKYVRHTDSVRWATMMDIGDQLHTLPRLKLPGHLTTGVWISQETLATTGPRVRDNDPYVAYVLLGETIGAPFRYISDWGVERKGASEFGDLKIIYVANAKWVPAGVRDRLTRWVKDGGILVVTKDDSFTQQIDGTTFDTWREALGVTGKPVSGERFDKWSVGKGQVLALKDNIWKMGIWDDSQRVAQVRELQVKYDGGTDEPIWRFRLPVKAAPVKTTAPSVSEKSGKE